jgi:hypothetical protein
MYEIVFNIKCSVVPDALFVVGCEMLLLVSPQREPPVPHVTLYFVMAPNGSQANTCGVCCEQSCNVTDFYCDTFEYAKNTI